MLVRKPGIERLNEYSVKLEGGEVLEDIDCIIYCTGYNYNFPFLKDAGAVTVEDNRVAPLYEHVFTPHMGATLSFIGLPWKVVPFPMMQLQSRWVAQALSGKIELPGEDTMRQASQEFYEQLDRSGVPLHHTHCMGDGQFPYNDMLSAITNSSPLPAWRKMMYKANSTVSISECSLPHSGTDVQIIASQNKRERPNEYRNTWDDHRVLEEAHRQMSEKASMSEVAS